MHWINKPFIFNIFNFQIICSRTKIIYIFYLFGGKLREMKCPSKSTESLTLQLKVFISSSTYLIIDPCTSSVVAFSSCSVEFLLAIFWSRVHRIFLLSRCHEHEQKRYFMCLQEFVIHFKTGKNLWLTLKNAFVQKVTMVLKTLYDDIVENCYNLTIIVMFI